MFLLQTSQVSRFGRVTHDFDHFLTISRLTLYMSRYKPIISCIIFPKQAIDETVILHEKSEKLHAKSVKCHQGGYYVVSHSFLHLVESRGGGVVVDWTCSKFIIVFLFHKFHADSYNGIFVAF